MIRDLLLAASGNTKYTVTKSKIYLGSKAGLVYSGNDVTALDAGVDFGIGSINKIRQENNVLFFLGQGKIRYSRDGGNTFTVYSFSGNPTNHVLDVIWMFNKWFFVLDGTDWYTSTDLVNFTNIGRKTAQGGSSLATLTQFGSLLVCALGYGTSSPGGVLSVPIVYTSDGVNWASSPIPPGTASFFSCRTNGSDYYALDVYGKLHKTQNMTAYTTETLVIDIQSLGVMKDGSMVIAVGNAGNNNQNVRFLSKAFGATTWVTYTGANSEFAVTLSATSEDGEKYYVLGGSGRGYVFDRNKPASQVPSIITIPVLTTGTPTRNAAYINR